MKNRSLLLMFFFFCLPLSGWAQIDDDIEYEDDFKVRPSDITVPNKAILNTYHPGDGIRITRLDRDHSMTLGGYVQTSIFVHRFPGDDQLYSRLRVRRVRLRFQGSAFGDKIRYRFGANMVQGSEGDDETGSLLHDAWIQYRHQANNKLVFTFGQRSNPTEGRESQMSTYSLQLGEGSKASSIFSTVREVGLFAEGTFKTGNVSYVRPSIALTDGDGPISNGPRHGGMKLGARINYLPFGLFRMSGETRQGDMVYELTPKLIVGVAYNHNWGTSDRRGGREGGSILYKNDRNEYDLPDFGKLNADFMFKYRGWSVLGTFTKSWVHVPETITQRVRNDGSVTPDFEIGGVQDVARYIKNRMMVGEAYNIQAGYMFRSFWSVDARYTHLKPEEYSYMNNTLYYSRNNIIEAGVSKYLSKSYSTKIQTTVGFIKTDGEVRNFRDHTYQGWEKTFNMMFQVAF